MAIANRDALIGVDLGGTKVAAGKIVKGEIVRTLNESIQAASEDLQETIALIKSVISRLMDDHIAGIGIGVPGLVDRELGIAYDVHNIPLWKEVHLKQILQEEFHIPVHLDNDSNCFALGEYRYGKYAGTRDFVGITIGTGMGSGIIKNGALLPDANGCSGEFGVIPYLDGIYEHYSSGMFFARKYGKNGEEVAMEAASENKWAIDAYEEFGMHLGNAVKTIKMAVDPGMIIIGGSVAKARSLFEEAMWKSIFDFSFPSALKNFRVVFSETTHAAIFGAAALCPV